MAKIVLDRNDVIDILKNHVFDSYAGILKTSDPEELTFNDWQLPYENLTFEKKIVREVKLEDVEDMVVEQLQVKRQEG